MTASVQGSGSNKENMRDGLHNDHHLPGTGTGEVFHLQKYSKLKPSHSLGGVDKLESQRKAWYSQDFINTSSPPRDSVVLEILQSLRRGDAPGHSYGYACANADDDIIDCNDHVNDVDWQESIETSHRHRWMCAQRYYLDPPAQTKNAAAGPNSLVSVFLAGSYSSLEQDLDAVDEKMRQVWDDHRSPAIGGRKEKDDAIWWPHLRLLLNVTSCVPHLMQSRLDGPYTPTS
jgi:hypothetical protein